MRANSEKQPGRWSARAALGGAAALALGLLLAGCGGEGQTARPPQGDPKKMMSPQERGSYEAYQKRGQRPGGAMGRPGMPGIGGPGMGGPGIGGPPAGVTPR